MGLTGLAGSLLVAHHAIDTVERVCLSSFWGIREMFEQQKRVRKGWYPKRKVKKGDECKSEKMTGRKWWNHHI